MPHTMNWEDHGVYKRFDGFVSYREYAHSQEEVLSNPRCDDIRFVINDLLAVEGYSLTREQAEYLAVFNRGSSLSNPKLRIAYVTTDTSIKLLIKLLSSLSALELGVFPTLDAAREWADAPR